MSNVPCQCRLCSCQRDGNNLQAGPSTRPPKHGDEIANVDLDAGAHDNRSRKKFDLLLKMLSLRDFQVARLDSMRQGRGPPVVGALLEGCGCADE